MHPTALLEHVTRTGRHYDWLIDDPTTGPDARLWTLRVWHPSRDWLTAGQLMLTELPPHRRLYLHYEGPISGDRGTVRRVDEGTVHPLLWTASRRVLEVSMTHFVGQVELRHLTEARWTGVVERR